MIQEVEAKAVEVEKDMEAGQAQITQAVSSAKKARKKRKICLCISIIFLLVIGGVVAYLVVKVILPKINENKDKANAETNSNKTVTVTSAAATKGAASTNNANAAAVTGTPVRAYAQPVASATSNRLHSFDPTVTARAYVWRDDNRLD